jgi:5-methylcytosine-specific restriction endonuclease McrA
VTEYLQVKDFDRFQHYKDRDPPWIKLYVRILEDYAFATLPDAQKAHLILIWVLASKMENKIPNDPAFVRNRIGANEVVNLDALQAAGFLHPWSPVTATGKREGWSSRYVSAQIRADLLSSAQHRCATCSATEHLEIDHIVPISKGGTGDVDNLQVLCRKCNRKKRVTLKWEAEQALRSNPLRRETDLRSPETETETETETEKATYTADAVEQREPEHNLRSCIGLVVEKLYFGNRPPEAAMRNEASIAKQLGEHYGYERLARAVEGLARRRDSGQLSGVGPRQALSLKWLNSKKFDINQLAASEDEFYRAAQEGPRGRGKVTDIGDVLATITPRMA